MVDELNQFLLGVRESGEYLWRRVYRCWRMGEFGVPSWYQVIPESYKLVHWLVIVKFEVFNWWCIPKPKKAMYMTATSMLPFKSLPIVYNI